LTRAVSRLTVLHAEPLPVELAAEPAPTPSAALAGGPAAPGVLGPTI
jgi:hypothetical protein